MLLFLAACATEPVQDTPGFLPSIVDRWWHLEESETDFCLASDNQVWLNIIGNPNGDDSLNVNGGEWEYEGDGLFFLYDDGDGYNVRARVLTEQPECYKLTYMRLRADIACPYEGEFD